MNQQERDKSLTLANSDELQLFKEVEDLFDKVPTVFSRIETALQKPLKVIDDQRLAKIDKRMKEINEKMYNFGRQDSQTTRKLMTLQMLNTADSTYRLLRQILAQIESTRMAIIENYTKLKENYILLAKLKKKLDNETDELKRAELKTKIQGYVASISDIFVYVEGALKEIGFLQDCYEQVKKNKNIRDDWDEVDFEKEEIKAHIRNAFRHGVRDFLVTGRLGMGTCEYFEQFGISPIEASVHISNYMNKCNQRIHEATQSGDYSRLPDYDDFHDFLDQMAEMYQNAYKKACRRMGLDDDIISKDFILMSARNKKLLLEEDD